MVRELIDQVQPSLFYKLIANKQIRDAVAGGVTSGGVLVPVKAQAARVKQQNIDLYRRKDNVSNYNYRRGGGGVFIPPPEPPPPDPGSGFYYEFLFY